jgi:hypothetical protein
LPGKNFYGWQFKLEDHRKCTQIDAGLFLPYSLAAAADAMTPVEPVRSRGMNLPGLVIVFIIILVVFYMAGYPVPPILLRAIYAVIIILLIVIVLQAFGLLGPGPAMRITP